MKGNNLKLVKLKSGEQDSQGESIISLGCEALGAAIGSRAGAVGAVIGVFVGRGVQAALKRCTENHQIKNRILDTLRFTENTQVVALMAAHGIPVPTDAFGSQINFPYLKALAKYKRALIGLESENKIGYSRRASVNHGFANPPYEWVNDWSGRAFYRSSAKIQ
jgi:hypothetical protein